MTIEAFSTTRYRCTTCRKSWATKHRAKEHVERGCHLDPTTRTCATCSHYRPANDGDGYTESNSPHYCSADIPIADLQRPELPTQCEGWHPYGPGQFFREVNNL